MFAASLRSCDRGWLVPAAPHLTRSFDDEAQFGFLLLDRQSVAFDGRGKAALRAEAELVERHVFRGLVDAALQIVLAFERRPLAGDETQYNALVASRHKAQRVEPAE